MPVVNRVSYPNPTNVNVETDGGGGGIDPYLLSLARKRLKGPTPAANVQEFDRGPTRLDQAREQDEIQELAYRQKLRDIDLNPPKKLISGFNINPGYIEDTSMLPVSMRPKSAGFVPGEANTAGIDPMSKGTGGFDPVAAEEAARGDLAAPGGNYGHDQGIEALVDPNAVAAADRRTAQKRVFKPKPTGSFGGPGY